MCNEPESFLRWPTTLSPRLSFWGDLESGTSSGVPNRDCDHSLCRVACFRDSASVPHDSTVAPPYALSHSSDRQPKQHDYAMLWLMYACSTTGKSMSQRYGSAVTRLLLLKMTDLLLYWMCGQAPSCDALAHLACRMPLVSVQDSSNEPRHEVWDRVDGAGGSGPADGEGRAERAMPRRRVRKRFPRQQVGD